MISKIILAVYMLLLDSGHAKEAKEYIKELYTCNKGLQGIIYSGNIVIDSILSNGLANLENRGINLKCSIIIPPSLNIADVDLCILFGNLLIMPWRHVKES